MAVPLALTPRPTPAHSGAVFVSRRPRGAGTGLLPPAHLATRPGWGPASGLSPLVNLFHTTVPHLNFPQTVLSSKYCAEVISDLLNLVLFLLGTQPIPPGSPFSAGG